MAKIGLLLCNIGTPKSFEVKDVKSYLLKFLMDKDVINIPLPLRWLLVHGIIVPRRAPFSAENYKKVWMEEGSPLWVYSNHFANKLQSALGSNYLVKLGMRYSEPSIETSLQEMISAGVSKIVLAPMFPQYAEATTGSVLKEFKRVYENSNINIPYSMIQDFFKDSGFIDSSAQIATSYLKGKKVDHYLFSFHGLPESHVRKNKGCLVDSHCCVSAGACEKPCYRAQCLQTAAETAKKLQLKPSEWSVSFQSRLGRAKWLQPSTESMIAKLALQKVQNLAVLCPSFVADCIETLEEIAIGGEETFHHNGGQNLYVVPCVNDSDLWVDGFREIIRK